LFNTTPAWRSRLCLAGIAVPGAGAALGSPRSPGHRGWHRWVIEYGCGYAFRVDDPYDYLTHVEFPVD
jgi:hypothetical protein